MGVSVGSSSYYVVISTLPAEREDPRKALFIGRVKTFEELDQLMVKYYVHSCLISMQPEPHLHPELRLR